MGDKSPKSTQKQAAHKTGKAAAKEEVKPDDRESAFPIVWGTPDGHSQFVGQLLGRPNRSRPRGVKSVWKLVVW